MKKIITILSSVIFLTMVSAKAEIQYGVGILAGQLNADGKETEGTAADTSVQTKSFEEYFVGADLFLENVSDSGLTIGVSYVPVDFKIGSGSRVDTSTGADIASEADIGTRKASADVTDLFTLYANVPVGDNGFYGLLGGHMATITTDETLPNSKYGNDDIYGYQVGFGQRVGKFKYELSYSDFEDISLNSSVTDASGTNKITADADAVTFRLSFGF